VFLSHEIQLPWSPVWVKCELCGGFVCLLHGLHVSDCSCPPIEQWAASPYEH